MKKIINYIKALFAKLICKTKQQHTSEAVEAGQPQPEVNADFMSIPLNHSVYEWDTLKGKIEKVPYVRIKDKKGRTRKAVMFEKREGCMYIHALNDKNAYHRFNEINAQMIEFTRNTGVMDDDGFWAIIDHANHISEGQGLRRVYDEIVLTLTELGAQKALEFQTILNFHAKRLEHNCVQGINEGQRASVVARGLDFYNAAMQSRVDVSSIEELDDLLHVSLTIEAVCG